MPEENQQNRVPNIDLSDSNLPVEEEEKVMNLVEKYSDIFSKDIRDLGRTGLIKHEFHTTETLPIKQKPFRHPKWHMKEARKHAAGRDDRRWHSQEEYKPMMFPSGIGKEEG